MPSRSLFPSCTVSRLTVHKFAIFLVYAGSPHQDACLRTSATKTSATLYVPRTRPDRPQAFRAPTLACRPPGLLIFRSATFCHDCDHVPNLYLILRVLLIQTLCFGSSPVSACNLSLRSDINDAPLVTLLLACVISSFSVLPVFNTLK